MTGYLKFAIFVGLLLLIPLCALIYKGFNGLERGASSAKDLRELRDFANNVGDFEKAARGFFGSNGEFMPELAYPVQRALENSEGKKLECLVLGRNSSDVFILSTRDNRHYNYPVSSLSEQDRTFVMNLPVYQKSPRAYPVARILRLTDGGRIAAEILERDQFELTYRLIGEYQHRILSINKLIDQDRKFVYGLTVAESVDRL